MRESAEQMPDFTQTGFSGEKGTLVNWSLVVCLSLGCRSIEDSRLDKLTRQRWK